MSRTDAFKTPEGQIIDNCNLQTLYNHEFEKGRFFQVVFQGEEDIQIKLAPKTMMKVVYLPDKNNIEGLEIIKVIGGVVKEKLKFSTFDLQQLRSFLSFINKIDLGSISERKIVLGDSVDNIDENTRKKFITLLSGTEGEEIIKELLDNGVLTSQDIVNTGYRKAQLEEFRKLLNVEGYLQIYKTEIGKPSTKDETAWQHFFNLNAWIFGYGLQYRFEGILQKEFHASDTTAAGSDGVINDFLMGNNQFTTFVEIKLPTTRLFKKDKNRSGSWQLSEELINAVSQILEQKASGMIKIETTKKLIDDKGGVINARAYDSKTILLIGDWKEVFESEEVEEIRLIKQKTLELFRRDSRNIEILTFDELYNRANFIVLNSEIKTNTI